MLRNKFSLTLLHLFGLIWFGLVWSVPRFLVCPRPSFTSLAHSLSSIVSGATAPQQAPPSKALLRKGPGVGEKEMEGGVQGEEPGREETLPRTSVSAPPNPSVPLSSPAPTLTPPPTPPPAQISCGLKEGDRERGKERSQG